MGHCHSSGVQSYSRSEYVQDILWVVSTVALMLSRDLVRKSVAT